jgi:hypothetical protein
VPRGLAAIACLPTFSNIRATFGARIISGDRNLTKRETQNAVRVLLHAREFRIFQHHCQRRVAEVILNRLKVDALAIRYVANVTRGCAGLCRLARTSCSNALRNPERRQVPALQNWDAELESDERNNMKHAFARDAFKHRNRWTGPRTSFPQEWLGFLARPRSRSVECSLLCLAHGRSRGAAAHRASTILHA